MSASFVATNSLPTPGLCEALARIAAAPPGAWAAAVIAEIARILERRDGLFWGVVLLDTLFFDAISQRRRADFVADGESEFFELWARRHAAKAARP